MSASTIDSAQRRYALSEIDRMRAALYATDYANGWSPWAQSQFSSMSSIEAAYQSKRSDIEDRLRTCMIGGVGPEELEAQAEAAKAEKEKRDEEIRQRDFEMVMTREYGPVK